MNQKTKRKILFTASIAKHIIRFHLPYLQWFQEQGYETHVACSGEEEIPYANVKHSIPFIRSPFHLGHFHAYSQLKELLNKESFTLIHCHTPMASVLTRLAARETRKLGTNVIYTAHGFHFFKGGPIHNWLTYYPMELWLSKFTDAIITINEEDFNLIKSRESSSTTIFKIPGIGVNQKRFAPVSFEIKNYLRSKNGFSKNDFIVVYAAEFIPRKNHQFIIDNAKLLLLKIPNVKILFAGRGILKESMEKRVLRMGLNQNVRFLGFRNDIEEIFQLSDIGISASKQEGLGLNLIEEMMCGLPIVATKDKGHREVVDHGINGYLFPQNNGSAFINSIFLLYSNPRIRAEFAEKAIVRASKFELINSLTEMDRIYSFYLKNVK